MVIPRYLKIHLPADAKPINTPAVTRQASRAILVRCSGVSVGVMARKAGTVATGSMITRSELEARKMYSARFIPDLFFRRFGRQRARSEDGFSHSVNNLFVRRTDRGDPATKLSASRFGFSADKIIRT